LEIGRILHLKAEIRNCELDYNASTQPVQSCVSDFGFEVQDSSDFQFPISAS